MSLRPSVEYACLVFAVLLTRISFRSHYLYDVDSVNFALALKRFAPAVHQPHPPGYFLYVCLGRLANTLFSDVNTALVAIGIAASCGAAIMISALGSGWFGRRAGAFAGLSFVISPLAWFHGTVALTYIVEAFFSALIGYLCWRICAGASSVIVPAAMVAGIAAGFRPSFLLFIGPLMLYSSRRASPKHKFSGLAALALTIAAWAVPMLRESGGWRSYVASFVSLWKVAAGRATVFNSPLATSAARLCTILFIVALLGGASLILLAPAYRSGRSIDKRKLVFSCFWIAPGLLFFTFVFLRFVNSGYLLVISPPLFAWLGLWAFNWYRDSMWRERSKVAAICLAVVLNTGVFLYAPIYCSYRSVQRFEAELLSIQRALPLLASPADTVIVGFDSHFLGYRHAGYYFPEFLTLQFPEIGTPAGLRTVTMRDRDTRWEAEWRSGSYTRLLFFPLPQDDREYRAYLQIIRARFGAGELHGFMSAGREYLTAPAADLAILFPGLCKRALTSRRAVYTAVNIDAPGSPHNPAK